MSSVIESKRTILELIVSASFQLVAGAGLGKVLVSDVGGTGTWQNVIPVGTRMVFYQAAAPLGWIAVAPDTLTDYMLRVVTVASGTGGASGGTWTGAGRVTAPAHTHAITDHNHDLIGNTGAVVTKSGLNGSRFQTDGPDVAKNLELDLAAATAGDHTHGLVGHWTGNIIGGYNSGPASSVAITHGSLQHQYANVILCEKS